MSAGDQARIFIIDDYSLIRRGLRQLFECEPDVVVCGDAANLAEGIPLIKKYSPDVAIIGISLPDGSGLDLIKRIRATNPDMAILLSSMHDKTLFAERALRAGAMGYINLKEESEYIVEAVRRIHKGKIYVSERMTEHLLQKNFNNHMHNISNDNDTNKISIDLLSDREMEVFMQIGSGRTTTQIAINLNLSIKTVETHRAHIKQKLGLDTTTELARCAMQWSIEGV